MNSVEIKNNKILKKQNFIYYENNINTVVGPNESGKTTLANILNKKIKSSILLNDDSKIDYDKKIDIYLKKLNLINLKDIPFEQLSSGERQIIIVLSGLIKEENIIIYDDCLSSVDLQLKNKLFKILKQKLKTKTIINITSDVEETIYGNYTSLINNGKILFQEKTLKALNKEKEFKNSNLDLPFMASLSVKLKYYELLNKVYLDSKKLVNELWK